MKLKYYLFAISFGLCCACKTPKDVVYFQGIDELTPEQLEQMSQTYSIRIENDDLLSIDVASWDPTSVSPFNPLVFRGNEDAESDNRYTYLVDQEGNINFPVIGKIHVAGLTRMEIASKLENLISKYVEKPLVNVRLLNFKIIVMGDVGGGGIYTIANDRISIIEAISRAGDLQLSANRKNILVIRDNNGKKETCRLDITDPAIFASPFFYLKQNDIVYVEPIKSKQRARRNADRSFTLSVMSAVISVVSVITSMVTTIVAIKK